MNCQVCTQNPATVHVLDLPHLDSDASGEATSSSEDTTFTEKHICEGCALGMKIPHMPVSDKGTVHFIKALKEQVRRVREEGSVQCPDCGMTLAEFRNKGRLGCPKDYEIFRAHLRPLLQRVHNAVAHVGRRPGLGEEEISRLQALTQLRAQLERAIREEAYESAARLRDEIQGLEESVSGEDPT